MTTPRVTVPVEPEGVSPVYNAAYDSIRKGAPGLSDATCAVIARSINMKVSQLSAAPAPEGVAVSSALDWLEYSLKEEWGPDSHHLACLALDRARAALATRSDDKPEGGAEVPSSWSIRYQGLATREEAPAEAGDTLHPDAQPFEQYPELALHIERMAMSGVVGSMISWDAFLRELNAALRAQPPAREDAQPEAWRMIGRDGSTISLQAEPYHGGFAHMMAADGGCTVQPLYTHPAPDALRVAVEALEPFARAYQAYLAAYANFMPSGATEAEKRFAEGERKDTAEEAAFEVLSKITLEQLCAVNEALAALQAEQGAT